MKDTKLATLGLIAGVIGLAANVASSLIGAKQTELMVDNKITEALKGLK